MRDMQKESAMTPNSCAARASEVGRDGRAMHTLHERPGTVWYPKSKSNVEASFAAHMPMLREGKDQKTEDQSKSRETFARRELVVARPHRDPRGIVQLETCRVGSAVRE